jgi:hypothetical protein
VDLDRAEAIATATSVLDEDTARQVEAKILPGAGAVTRALLRERLARAVIAADPDGAERRREQAGRHADVRLYADADHTATITLPFIPPPDGAPPDQPPPDDRTPEEIIDYDDDGLPR